MSISQQIITALKLPVNVRLEDVYVHPVPDDAERTRTCFIERNHNGQWDRIDVFLREFDGHCSVQLFFNTEDCRRVIIDADDNYALLDEFVELVDYWREKIGQVYC